MTRQDAWSANEDSLLVKIVMQNIRQGGTQLAAFEEAGNKLSRTAAACGFRWNSTLRKKYENEIILAKKQRKQETKVHRKDSTKQTDPPPDITLKEIISFLQSLEEHDHNSGELHTENERLKQELEEVKSKYEKQIQQLNERNQALQKDYETIVEVMEKARKWMDSQEN